MLFQNKGQIRLKNCYSETGKFACAMAQDTKIRKKTTFQDTSQIDYNHRAMRHKYSVFRQLASELRLNTGVCLFFRMQS